MARVPLSKIVGAILGGWREDLARVALTLSIPLLLTLWLYTLLRHKTWKGTFPLPPGPRGLPLVGNLPFLRPNLHRCFSEYARTYGPIFNLRLGNKLFIVVSSPSIAKEVYKENDIIFSNHDQPIAAGVVSYNGSNLVRCPYGPTWRMLRRVFVNELLNSRSLDACYGLRRRVVRRMARDLYSKNGAAIDVGEAAFATTLNLLASMLWGGELWWETIGTEFRRAVVETVELMGRRNISDFFPFLARFDLQGVEREIKERVSWLDRVYEALIEERARLDGAEEEEGGEKGEERKDLLSILLRIRNDGDAAEVPLTDANLKGLIMDLMVGGTNTISTTVEWIMAELMHRPDIDQRARQELAAVVGGPDTAVEESHIPRLKYLRAVIKEVLRLHPVVPLLVPRVPSEPCVLSGGYLIPAGARVVTNVWAIHTDPGLWDSPAEFRPERFLNEGSGAEFRYFPFGAGLRRCAGLPLVERMLPLVVATLLHAFEWRVPEGVELDLCERPRITLTKERPVLAIPIPRFSNPDIYG
ncbi:flavonoid 3'-monooxygenase CYP75B137-like [Phoenix dactylifera]|uniref:Flavonoid 3'-monooxygenase CYP75B137-like n=1 Tax=Phoenix dactylifera TaxID=42345 RepID=A0A8B7MT91_PHODC|nr:flavonoid 3'-monooxygenase CYP75B137-like [Phoenix dactylifera]